MIRTLQNAGPTVKIILAGILLVICGGMIITLIPGGLGSSFGVGAPARGVVASVAVADGLAVTCATDGKVQAYDLGSGERRWIYDAKAPLFAPAAVVGGVAYVGDLRGVVHAVGLADGKEKWKLDLGADPTVKAPGMIYAGPVLHSGKVYVVTCNLEGQYARQPTAVVCIGAK